MNKNKSIIFLLFLVGIFIMAICLIQLHNSIFYPAYLSTITGCKIINSTELDNLGYYISANYIPSNNTINLFVPTQYTESSYKLTNQYKTSLKHELCHKRQFEENRLNSCWVNSFNFPIGVFLNEVECYYKQY